MFSLSDLLLEFFQNQTVVLQRYKNFLNIPIFGIWGDFLTLLVLWEEDLLVPLVQ